MGEISFGSISTWGQPEADLLTPSHTNHCRHYFIVMNLLSHGTLNAFNHPWLYQLN